MMAIFALSFASTAQAGYYRYVETCTSMSPTPGHNYKVVVAVHFASHVDTVNQEETVAVLTEESSSSPVEIGSYEVEFKAPQRGIVGSRGSYVGQDFSLSFPLVPLHDGASIAHLTATQNRTYVPTETPDTDVQVNETVLCHGDL